MNYYITPYGKQELVSKTHDEFYSDDYKILEIIRTAGSGGIDRERVFRLSPVDYDWTDKALEWFFRYKYIVSESEPMSRNLGRLESSLENPFQTFICDELSKKLYSSNIELDEVDPSIVEIGKRAKTMFGVSSIEAAYEINNFYENEGFEPSVSISVLARLISD